MSICPCGYDKECGIWCGTGHLTGECESHAGSLIEQIDEGRHGRTPVEAAQYQALLGAAREADELEYKIVLLSRALQALGITSEQIETILAEQPTARVRQ